MTNLNNSKIALHSVNTVSDDRHANLFKKYDLSALVDTRNNRTSQGLDEMASQIKGESIRLVKEISDFGAADTLKVAARKNIIKVIQYDNGHAFLEGLAYGLVSRSCEVTKNTVINPVEVLVNYEFKKGDLDVLKSILNSLDLDITEEELERVYGESETVSLKDFLGTTAIGRSLVLYLLPSVNKYLELNSAFVSLTGAQEERKVFLGNCLHGAILNDNISGNTIDLFAKLEVAAQILLNNLYYSNVSFKGDEHIKALNILTLLLQDGSYTIYRNNDVKEMLSDCLDLVNSRLNDSYFVKEIQMLYADLTEKEIKVLLNKLSIVINFASLGLSDDTFIFFDFSSLNSAYNFYYKQENGSVKVATTFENDLFVQRSKEYFVKNYMALEAFK